MFVLLDSVSSQPSLLDILYFAPPIYWRITPRFCRHHPVCGGKRWGSLSVPCLKRGNRRSLDLPHPRKSKRFQIELIHEQLPLPVPCYDLLPVTELTVDPAKAGASGISGSLELTGGEYKTRERIHRSLADLRLLAIPASRSRVADFYPN